MKKFLLCYAVLTTALLACACRSCRHARGESRRLADNQTALASEVERYRTRLGEEVASVQALRLRCAEFEELRAADAARIRQLGIAGAGSKPRRRARRRPPRRTPRAAARHARSPPGGGPRMGHPAAVPLARSVGHGRRVDRPRLGRMPHPQRRYPAPGRAPRPAPVPLHPLGHESPPAADRLVEPPHADRLHGVRPHRALTRTQPQDTPAE